MRLPLSPLEHLPKPRVVRSIRIGGTKPHFVSAGGSSGEASPNCRRRIHTFSIQCFLRLTRGALFRLIVILPRG